MVKSHAMEMICMRCLVPTLFLDKLALEKPPAINVLIACCLLKFFLGTLSEESFQHASLYFMAFLKNMEVQTLISFSWPRDVCSVSAFLYQWLEESIYFLSLIQPTNQKLKLQPSNSCKFGYNEQRLTQAAPRIWPSLLHRRCLALMPNHTACEVVLTFSNCYSHVL